MLKDPKAHLKTYKINNYTQSLLIIGLLLVADLFTPPIQTWCFVQRKNPKKDTTKHKSYLETECLNPTFSDDSPWAHQSQSRSDSTSVIARWCRSVCVSVEVLSFTLQLYLLMFFMHIGKSLLLSVELWKRTPKTSQKRGMFILRLP